MNIFEKVKKKNNSNHHNFNGGCIYSYKCS